MIAVVGATGSGKTSLLRAIAGDMNLNSGEMCISGSVSYCSQKPWIVRGTARHNIRFGLEEEQEKYLGIVEDCRLERDFHEFKNGDRVSS